LCLIQHPKQDPRTGETVTYGYEAKGEGTTDVAYTLFDKAGNKIEEFWFKSPYCGIMHDIGITPNYVIFQMSVAFGFLFHFI
jgi:carotenoid cleavage dioxygenase-like enzyme